MKPGHDETGYLKALPRIRASITIQGQPFFYSM